MGEKAVLNADMRRHAEAGAIEAKANMPGGVMT